MNFDLKTMLEYMPVILRDGLVNTLQISLIAFIISFVFSLLVALLRIYRVPVISQILTVYVSLFRGTPLMVQILIFYYGAPALLEGIVHNFSPDFDVNTVPTIVWMIICYVLCYSAYLSENMRSAIQAVPAGQWEAGYSMGMHTPKVFMRVIFPQAMVVALPNLGNMFLDIIKASSLAFVAAVTEILGSAKIIAGRTYKYLEAYVAAALIYWVLCIIADYVIKLIEKRARKYERRV